MLSGAEIIEIGPIVCQLCMGEKIQRNGEAVDN